MRHIYDDSTTPYDQTKAYIKAKANRAHHWLTTPTYAISKNWIYPFLNDMSAINPINTWPRAIAVTIVVTTIYKCGIKNPLKLLPIIGPLMYSTRTPKQHRKIATSVDVDVDTITEDNASTENITPNGADEHALVFVGNHASRYFSLLDQCLDEDIKHNAALYAPIISTVIIQCINIGSLAAQWSISALAYLLKQKSENSIELIQSYIEEAERNMLVQAPDYIVAHQSFKSARLLIEKHFNLKHDAILREKYITLCYKEALALFYLGRYETPFENNAQAILSKACKLPNNNPSAINLYAIIQLQKEVPNKFETKKMLEKSLNLNPSQTDIFILKCYCEESYEQTLSYNETAYAGKQTHKDLTWFITLYYHGLCLYKYTDKLSSEKHKLPFLLRAKDLGIKALEETPPNPIFTQNMNAALKLILDTSLIILKIATDKVESKQLFYQVNDLYAQYASQLNIDDLDKYHTQMLEASEHVEEPSECIISFQKLENIL